MVTEKIELDKRYNKKTTNMTDGNSREDLLEKNLIMRQQLFQKMQANIEINLAQAKQSQRSLEVKNQQDGKEVSDEVNSDNKNSEDAALIKNGPRKSVLQKKGSASFIQEKQSQHSIDVVMENAIISPGKNQKKNSMYFDTSQQKLDRGKVSDEDKEYQRQKHDHQILTNYVQVLFKKVENVFTKEDINKPSDNLRNALLINKFLKSMFYLILLVLVLSLCLFKYYINHNEQLQSLTNNDLLLSYHNATLDTLQRYFQSDLYSRNYFGVYQTPKDIEMQKSYLNNSIATMKSIIFENQFRKMLLFSDKSQDVIKIRYDNLTNTYSKDKLYNLSLEELTTQYLNKIDSFRAQDGKINLDYFILQNFFQHSNVFMLERIDVLYDYQDNANLLSFNYNLAFFVFCCVLYVCSLIGILRLSRIITPCLNALIAGFNFINLETLEKINLHIGVQISFLNELKM